MIDESKNGTAIARIITLTDNIYRAMEPEGVQRGLADVLAEDLTIAQLRVLLLLHSGGARRMGEVAAYLQVSLPTATGIMDKLVTKGLAERSTDTADRRVVICHLSPAGQKTTGSIWDVGRQQIGRMLAGLSAAELEQAEKVAELLLGNLQKGRAAAGGGNHV